MVPKVIFFDFNGVLSSAKFWHHLEDTHPIRLAGEELFQQHSVIDDWMTGLLLPEEIINKHFPHSIRSSALEELRYSCQRIPLDREVLECAEILRPQTDKMVVATDNMHCLSDYLNNHDDLYLFDSCLISSELRVLKREPEAFFSSWLKQHSLNPSDALLIDDGVSNCAVFRDYGGRAIRYTDPEELRQELNRWFVIR